MLKSEAAARLSYIRRLSMLNLKFCAEDLLCLKQAFNFCVF